MISPLALLIAIRIGGAGPFVTSKALFSRPDDGSIKQKFILYRTVKTFLFFLLPGLLDAEHPHELVPHKCERVLVPREHEVVNITPCLAVIQVLCELLDRPLVDHCGLWSALGPRSHS